MSFFDRAYLRPPTKEESTKGLLRMCQVSQPLGGIFARVRDADLFASSAMGVRQEQIDGPQSLERICSYFLLGCFPVTVVPDFRFVSDRPWLAR